MSRDTQIGEEEKQKQVVVGNRSTNWTAEKTKKFKTFCFPFCISLSMDQQDIQSSLDIKRTNQPIISLNFLFIQKINNDLKKKKKKKRI